MRNALCWLIALSLVVASCSSVPDPQEIVLPVSAGPIYTLAGSEPARIESRDRTFHLELFSASTGQRIGNARVSTAMETEDDMHSFLIEAEGSYPVFLPVSENTPDELVIPMTSIEEGDGFQVGQPYEVADDPARYPALSGWLTETELASFLADSEDPISVAAFFAPADGIADPRTAAYRVHSGPMEGVLYIAIQEEVSSGLVPVAHALVPLLLLPVSMALLYFGYPTAASIVTLVGIGLALRSATSETPMVEIPDLRGWPDLDALHELESLGHDVIRAGVDCPDPNSVGRVVAQAPLAGTKVYEFAIVNLWICNRYVEELPVLEEPAPPVSESGLPDLIVSALRVEISPSGQGMLITYAGTIRNQGSAAAGASTLAIFENALGAIDVFAIPALVPDGTNSFSGSYAIADQRSFKLTAFADVNLTVQESVENNNDREFTGDYSGGLPDLVISTYVVTIEPSGQGVFVSYSGTIRNEGSTQAAASTLGILESELSLIKTFSIPSLTPGGTHDFSGSYAIADDRSFSLTFLADAGRVVQESSESNNNQTYSGTYSVAAPAPPGPTGSPDLIVESLTHTPQNPTTQDMITFTATVKNVGDATAGASTLVFKVGGESNPPSFAIPPLAPGQSHSVQRQENLSVAQNYQNTATADASGQVSESDEGNNVETDVLTVTSPSAPTSTPIPSATPLPSPPPPTFPDLIVSSLTHSPQNPTTQDTITFTATVKNVGDATAGASTLVFKVGGESNPPSFAIPSLAPGQSHSVQRQENLSVAQNYQNTATADASGQVSESDEGNNVETDVLTVTSPSAPTSTPIPSATPLPSPPPPTFPDLIVSSLTHSPQNPTTQDTITFTATVKNVGDATAGASTLVFKVGGESNPPSFAIPSLAPGQSHSVQRQENLSVAQNYQNTATADASGQVSESDEGNNVATDFFTVS